MIYFDHAATTFVKPIALWAIEKTPFGNPNSIHKEGLEAAQLVRECDNIVKRHINGRNGKIIWLNSASLANHFVISNAFRTGIYTPNAFICMKTAHKSIRRFGREDNMLTPLESGLISIKELTETVTNDTRLVSMLYVNNETGVIQPIDLIKPKIKKALYHVDAVQAAGKLPINTQKIGCDFLTLSGHKFGTPKGIACLWVKDGIDIDLPYLGTPPVPMIHAFAKTLISYNLMERKVDIILKEQFFKKRLQQHGSLNKIKFDYNIQTIRRLPGILSMNFEGIDASELSMRLSDKGLAVSTGSACSSKEIASSHVLDAMGYSKEKALSTVRISLSPENTWEELEKGVIIITDAVKDMTYDRS